MSLVVSVPINGGRKYKLKKIVSVGKSIQRSVRKPTT